MEVNEFKIALARVVRNYHSKGWSPASSTNYSFRTALDLSKIYISRSGVDKSEFSEHDFIEVDFNGHPLPEFEGVRPSAETLIHCELYKLFPEMCCIVHSHSVYSVLHSALDKEDVLFEGYEILKGFDGVSTHEVSVDLPIFENDQVMLRFSKTLSENINRLSIPAFIMRKHGTYAWGKSLADAKRHLETAEYLLEVEWKLSAKKLHP